MLRLRKIAVAFAMSILLTFSSTTVFAESMEDTVDLPSEISINKLVALKVMPVKGSTYNPDDALTRGDLVYVVNRIMKLNAPKSLKIKDVTAKSADFASISKVVGSGLLKLDAKGNFNASKGVTYAEFSRALANGLGLKLAWTDRPIDFLFFLDRKGVLSLDTDLDAMVTRGDAAVAVDHYTMIKNLFKSDSGVVSSLNDTSIVVNNGTAYNTYQFAANMATYMAGQFQDTFMFQPGTPVEMLFDEKGNIAFMSGSGFTLEEGDISYGAGKVKIGSTSKNVNLNAHVSPLPNNPGANFTLYNVAGYAGAGVTYGGVVYVNNASDEVTRFDVYMAKIEELPISVSGSNITVDFSGAALANQWFKPSDEMTITLKGTPDKTITLDELRTLQDGNDLTATLNANADGEVTAITVTATAKAAG